MVGYETEEMKILNERITKIAEKIDWLVAQEKHRQIPLRARFMTMLRKWRYKLLVFLRLKKPVPYAADAIRTTTLGSNKPYTLDL